MKLKCVGKIKISFINHRKWKRMWNNHITYDTKINASLALILTIIFKHSCSCWSFWFIYMHVCCASDIQAKQHTDSSHIHGITLVSRGPKTVLLCCLCKKMTPIYIYATWCIRQFYFINVVHLFFQEKEDSLIRDIKTKNLQVTSPGIRFFHTLYYHTSPETEKQTQKYYPKLL